MFNIKLYKGTTRVVLLVWKLAFKFPRINCGHYNFLLGCSSNWGERKYCKMMKNIENNQFYNLAAPSIYCSWFGLIQIQHRCIVNTTNLTFKQLELFKNVRKGESKCTNFGYYKNRLVCLDYS